MSRGKWLIPDDYDDVNSEWVHVIMCIPNTPKWRAVVTGAIYNLTRGRNWDEETGIIKVAQVIGRRIFGSMTMDCNNSLPRIADSLESIDSKIPQLVTLTEFMNGLEDSSVIGAIANWLDLGTALADIMPNLELRLTPVEWARFFFDMWWKRAIQGDVNRIANALQMLQFIEGGETVAEGAEAIDGWLDDISDWVSIVLQGGAVGAESLQAYALLRDLFTAEGSDSDLDLRNYNRVTNEVFVEGDAMTVNVNNSQVVYCGGTSAACVVPVDAPVGTPLDSPSYDLPEGEEQYPPDFASHTLWLGYKCQAAHAMILNFAETLFQIRAKALGALPDDTRTVMTEALYTLIRGTDFMMGAGWLYDISLYNNLTAWTAENIVDRIYQETDLTPFDIFLDLRSDMILNIGDYACNIYLANSGQQVIIDLASYISDQLDTLGYSAEITAWALGVISDAMTYQWGNIPFVQYDNISDAVISPTPDCSECGGGCQTVQINYGTGVITSTTVQVDSELVSGFRELCSVGWDRDLDDFNVICGEGVTITGCDVDYGTIAVWYLYDVDNVKYYNSTQEPTWPQAGVTRIYAFDGDTGADPCGITVTYSRS